MSESCGIMLIERFDNNGKHSHFDIVNIATRRTIGKWDSAPAVPDLLDFSPCRNSEKRVASQLIQKFRDMTPSGEFSVTLEKAAEEMSAVMCFVPNNVPVEFRHRNSPKEIIEMKTKFEKDQPGLECTCETCRNALCCGLAFDPYNTSGDCLLEK